MNKGARLIVLLFLAAVSCDTERNVSPDFRDHFIRYYGEDGNQFGVDMIIDPTEQSIMILGGSVVKGTKRIYLSKTDFEGNLIWETYLGYSGENPRDIERDMNGDYVILSNHDTLGQVRIKLLKVGTDGSKKGESVFNYSTWTEQNGIGLTAISDGGYMVTGNVPDAVIDSTLNAPVGPTDEEDIIVVRFNSDLTVNTNWPLRAIGANIRAAGVKIFEKQTVTDDSVAFYLFGYSDEPINSTTPNLNLYFLGLYETGGYGASLNAGDPQDLEMMAGAIHAPAELNNVFFVVGTQTTASGQTGLYIIKLFNEILFDRKTNVFSGGGKVISDLPNELHGVSACPSVTNPPGFILTAKQVTSSGATTHTNLWLGKVDLIGNLLWSQTFGYIDNDDEAASVAELPDGRIVLLGTVYLHNQNKISLIIVNPNGELSN